MSKPRLSIRLQTTDSQTATTMQDAILTQLIGKSMFDSITPMARSVRRSGTGGFLVTFDARFNLLSDRDGVKTHFLLAVSSLPVSITEYEMMWHQCSHDDPSVVDCRTTAYGSATL